jgi:two-component system sensor histidine kinase KdpD
MVLISSFLEVSTLEALANLVALALERARFLEAVSHTAAVRQSDRLESALLASVSHNLRTPLTAIRTSIDSLLRQDCAWDPQIQSEFHLIISEETYRLTQIVENLLAMARIEAGELKLLKQWSTVAEIFENVQERCATIMREHVLIVEQCETLPAIKVDSPLLAEVLANLLENAAKYTPTNSKIWLSACLEKQHLLISVIDEGPGIAPSEISRVFDKFYRGQAGQTRAPGTGMGLAIAKGIVEAHSGKIQVENILGGGAKFSFIIPVETKPLEELIANKDLYDAQTNNLSS